MTDTDVAQPAQAEAPPAAPPPRSAKAALWLLRGRTLIVLVILVIIFSAISSEYLTQSNLILMTKHVAINAILAMGSPS